ncbi:hypothetical protein AVEN_192723-1 [Araneus ventricosus]|uniref:Uncharacterized protein n=1 Tax=Araneus ventricosus TaxID=182803 RepID=A0A4Y2U9Q1_ARAVE|nr:hypothetical protein AVEN_192723-1 [Araneus ventricosus]
MNHAGSLRLDFFVREHLKSIVHETPSEIFVVRITVGTSKVSIILGIFQSVHQLLRYRCVHAWQLVLVYLKNSGKYQSLYDGKSLTPQFLLHGILWVAVSSTVGLCVERRHHLQSVCLQDVVLVDQTDENRLGLSLVGQCYNIRLTNRLSPKRFSSDDDDGDEMMTTFKTKSYCG